MIIAGLGNPGNEYKTTRHNAGFWAVDSIIDKFRAGRFSKDKMSLTWRFNLSDVHCTIVKPQTYMNLSGEAIAALMLEQSLLPDQLLVITDDINLPTGRIRLRSSGSDGGHNGLKSIISHVGREFWRLRIGIGLPENNEDESHSELVSHVLGSISPQEQAIFSSIIAEIPEIAALWLKGMGGKAMTQFNGKKYSAPAKIDDL